MVQMYETERYGALPAIEKLQTVFTFSDEIDGDWIKISNFATNALY